MIDERTLTWIVLALASALFLCNVVLLIQTANRNRRRNSHDGD